MKARRYEIKDLKTGKVHIFTGGKEAAEKRNALELELEAFESTSDPVCPKCGQEVKLTLSAILEAGE